MLRKIIAIAMGFVLLANPSMIVSAGTESKEPTVAATTVVTQEYPESVETTVVSSEALDETTTNTAETMSPEDVGSAIREGLDVQDGKHLFIANTPEEFVSVINKCVAMPDLCSIISENAQHYISVHHNNTVVSKQLEDFYQNILNLR